MTDSADTPRKIINVIGRIIRATGIAVGTVVSVIILAVILLAFAAATFVFVSGIMGIPAIYTDFPYMHVLNGYEFYLILGSAYLATISILGFLWLIGTSLVERKNKLKPVKLLILTNVLIISAIVGGVAIAKVAPEYQARYDSYQENMRAEMEYPVTKFNQITAGGSANIHIVQGPEYSVKATGNRDVLDLLVIKNEGDSLDIGFSHNVAKCIFCFQASNITIEITTPDIKNLSAEDGVDINVDTFILNDLSLITRDAGFIRIETTAKEIKLEALDASQVSIKGSTNNLTARLSDVSRLRAENLEAKDADVMTEDTAKAYVQVNDSLKAKATDISRIFYTGTPFTEIEESSSSNIQKRE